MKDVDYVRKISSLLSDFEADEEKFDNKSLLWDYIKCKIRGITISHAAHVSKQRKLHEYNLTETLNLLERQLSETPSSQSLQSCEKTRKELVLLHLEKAKGTAIRSNVEGVQTDISSINYLYNIEKRNLNMKCIRCLQTQNSITTKEEQILNEQKHTLDLSTIMIMLLLLA